jgi:outer membrane lipoprotein-sorting protein
MFMRCWMFVAFISLMGATTGPSGLSSSSSLDQILDSLDARGKTLTDFTAEVKLSDANNATGDEMISSGKIFFQRVGDDDARIRIDFDKKQLDNKIFDQNHTYVLDSGWLIERNYNKKQEIRRQILKPGEKLNLFKLGEGPFPLPIGQDKEDVKGAFDVGLVPAEKDDPVGSVHIKLTPKPDTHLAHDFSTIDIWVDLATAMPVRIQTLNVDQTAVKTTDLSDLKLNGGLSDKDFEESALPGGWDQTIEPYEGE